MQSTLRVWTLTLDTRALVIARSHTDLTYADLMQGSKLYLQTAGASSPLTPSTGSTIALM